LQRAPLQPRDRRGSGVAPGSSRVVRAAGYAHAFARSRWRGLRPRQSLSRRRRLNDRRALTAAACHPKLRAHEPQIRAGAEVAEVREDGADLAIGEPEPLRERYGVLLDGGSRNQSSRADVVGLIGADNRIGSVHISSLYGAADG